MTACIFVILLAVALAYLGFFNMVGGLFVPRGEVITGTLPVTGGFNETDIIPEGEIKYRINKEVTFENGYSKGDIMMENPKACEYSISFSFYLKPDGEEVYSSPRIERGQYLYGDKLKKKLHKGEYECVYTAYAYDSAGVLAGTYEGGLTINIEN